MRGLGGARTIVAAVMGAAILAVVVMRWDRPGTVFPAPEALRGANLLLVTVDTLRADRVGAYGAAHPTPTLDGLAASGVRFSRAYTHSVMTLPAHASLLTGRVPPAHGVRNNGTYRLADDADTLAERLRDAGYRTGAFVGAFVLDRRFGLAQGFEIYDDRLSEPSALDFRVAERPAPEVLAAAGQWLDGLPAKAPWFAWVHLFDPHSPYQAGSPSTGDPYTDEVLAVDRSLGTFLARLRRAGRLDATIVVVTADHGESLGEHGEATHGLFAYDSTLRVPLIVAGPGIPGSVVDTPSAHVDVTATLLALLGVRSTAVDGRGLMPLPDTSETARPIYFEALDANLTRDWAPLVGVVSGSWKYIDLPVPELYDLSADPSEVTNLAARDPGRRDRLVAALRGWQAAGGAAAGQVALDADAAARLRSLGYASGAAANGTRRAYTAADDPKNLIAVHREFMASLERAEQGDADGAVRGLRQVIAERPTFAGAYTAAASVLIGSGRARDAVQLLYQARRQGVASPEIDRRLASAMLAAGEPQDAIRVLEAVPHAGDPETLNLMGVALLAVGRAQDARSVLRRAVDLNPTSAGVWTNIGLLEIRVGRRPDARAAFRRAVEIDPNAVDAWRGLGAAAISTGDARGAADAWARAVALDPADSDTLFNLCVVLAELSPPSAVPYVDRFLALPGTDAADRARIAAIRDTIQRTQKAPDAANGARR